MNKSNDLPPSYDEVINPQTKSSAPVFESENNISATERLISTGESLNENPYSRQTTTILAPASQTGFSSVPTRDLLPQNVQAGNLCPNCRNGILLQNYCNTKNTCCAILLYPIGLICCGFLNKRVCSHCNSQFKNCD